MRSYRHTRLAAALLLSLGSASALAQQETGLRIQKSGSGRTPLAIGLQLRFVDSRSSLFSLPEEKHASDQARLSNRTFSSILADWQFHPDGFRASTGLVWQYSRGFMTEPGAGAKPTLRSATPYIGLGWNNQALDEKGWRFSADLGSFVTKRSGQESADHELSYEKADGLKWKPYLSIGVHLNY